MIEDNGDIEGGGGDEARAFDGRACEDGDDAQEDGDADQHEQEVVDAAAATRLERRFEEELHGAPGDGGDLLPAKEVDHHEIAERLGHRQLVILISDLFDSAEKLIEAFHHFRHDRHEVIVLQIMADDELTFPFRKFSLFEHLETGTAATDRLKLDPVTVRATYLENLARHLKTIRDGCNALRIGYHLFNTSDSVEKALTAYLAQRMGSR